MNTPATGMVKVTLMGETYSSFSHEHPDYLRLIKFNGTEPFSKKNPCATEIGRGFGTCRMILGDAVQEGIDDGTIRADIDSFLLSMYLMFSFMGILSLEDKWKMVIEAEGFTYEQFTREFLRFITPAVSAMEKPDLPDSNEPDPMGSLSTTSAV